MDDWFGGRVAEQDVFIEDFAKAVFGDDTLDYLNFDHELVWLRNHFDDEIEERAACTDIAAALAPKANVCVKVELQEILNTKGAAAGTAAVGAAAAVAGAVAMAML